MVNEILFKLFYPVISQAQILSSELKTEQDNIGQIFQSKAGFGTGMTLGDVAYKVIQGFLSLLAIIFIILVIYAGYSWMTAGGDEAKVTKAKDTIYRAIIGLILILAAYSITYFVFKYVPFGGNTGYTGY
jgi:amino acid transporter